MKGIEKILDQTDLKILGELSKNSRITMKDSQHEPYLSYIKAQGPFVIQNYKISGDSCYLLECKFPSNEVLDEFLVGLSEFVNYKLSIVIRK